VAGKAGAGSMKTAIVILVGAVLTFSGVWSNPASCEWDEVEVAVTFVFSGIFEGQDLVLENVYRSLTGPFTYPSEMEMIESIPEIPWVDHLAYNSTFGTYSLFYSSPDDFGGYGEAVILRSWEEANGGEARRSFSPFHPIPAGPSFPKKSRSFRRSPTSSKTPSGRVIAKAKQKSASA